MKKLIILTVLSPLYLAIVFAQDVPNENKKMGPFQDSLSTGYLLPEVNFSSELLLKILYDDEVADRAEEFGAFDFRMYIIKTGQAIEKNDSDIAFIKSKIKMERGKTAEKHWKEITTLDIQNEQLKTEIWNYMHYGIGNWDNFKSETNEDLTALVNDLGAMKQQLALVP
jgi:hypothetical protein